MPQAVLKYTTVCSCSICDNKATVFIGQYDPVALQVSFAVDKCVPQAWQLVANRKKGTLLICDLHDIELVISQPGTGKYSESLVTGKAEKTPLSKGTGVSEKKKK